MKRITMAVAMLLTAACAARAQEDARVTAAVAPLPEEFRATATVLVKEPGKSGMTTLRKANGPFICLADEPGDERFHVACYHRNLEAFMARGRELREQKVTNVDSVRYAEIDAKKLAMPNHPAALYSLTGKAADPASARRLYVVYIPFATAESTGLSAKSSPNMPWIMYPGTAKAHIMFVPTM